MRSKPRWMSSQYLANVSTNGFKRSRAVFEDLLYQTIRQPGAQSSQQTQLPSGLQTWYWCAPGGRRTYSHTRQSPANRQSAGCGIQGAGFLQVLMPDGTTAYTRDGALQRDSQGQLVTSSGFAIQPAITIRLMRSMSRLDWTVLFQLPSQALPHRFRSVVCNWRHSLIRPDCKVWVRIFIRKQLRPVRPAPMCPERTVAARSVRIMWRLPTSMWWKKWLT